MFGHLEKIGVNETVKEKWKQEIHSWQLKNRTLSLPGGRRNSSTSTAPSLCGVGSYFKMLEFEESLMKVLCSVFLRLQKFKSAIILFSVQPRINMHNQS